MVHPPKPPFFANHPFRNLRFRCKHTPEGFHEAHPESAHGKFDSAHDNVLGWRVCRTQLPPKNVFDTKNGLKNAKSQKNPRAHKNKIGTPPPKRRNFVDMCFPAERMHFPGAHKLAQPFPAPELRTNNFTDTRIFLKRGSKKRSETCLNNFKPLTGRLKTNAPALF